MGPIEREISNVIKNKFFYQNWANSLTKSIFNNHETTFMCDVHRGCGKSTYAKILAFYLGLRVPFDRIALMTYESAPAVNAYFDSLCAELNDCPERLVGRSHYNLIRPNRSQTTIEILPSYKDPGALSNHHYDIIIHDEMPYISFAGECEFLLSGLTVITGSETFTSKQICLYTSKEKEKQTFDGIEWMYSAELDGLGGVL